MKTQHQAILDGLKRHKKKEKMWRERCKKLANYIKDLVDCELVDTSVLRGVKEIWPEFKSRSSE